MQYLSFFSPAAIKKFVHNLPPATNPSAEAGDEDGHREMAKLSSGPLRIGAVVYEDMDVTMESSVRQVEHSGGTGLPPPPPVPRSRSGEEYEDMDQYCASEDVTMTTSSGRGHCSQTWGLPPPPPLPIKDNADPQYEDVTQYNASNGVTMVANPCYDTKDS